MVKYARQIRSRTLYVTNATAGSILIVSMCVSIVLSLWCIFCARFWLRVIKNELCNVYAECLCLCLSDSRVGLEEIKNRLKRNNFVQTLASLSPVDDCSTFLAPAHRTISEWLMQVTNAAQTPCTDTRRRAAQCIRRIVITIQHLTDTFSTLL